FFLRLLLGHLIGDFILQPYWLVLSKRKGWVGLFIHVGVVTFITAILAWDSIPNWWVWIFILFIGHLFIDQFRTFVFTDNSKGKGLLLLFLDQLAHLLLITLLAWAATGWDVSDLGLVLSDTGSGQYSLMVYLAGLATMIGVVPVLEAEITVAVWAAQGREVGYTVEISTADRLVGSLERIVAAALILLGYGYAAPFVFLPRLALMIYQGKARSNRTAVITKVLTSFATTIIVSLLLYQIPF
ncbi:MAG: DUF3307 domain-containing protein, partial [Chloroflexota bacterium]